MDKKVWMGLFIVFIMVFSIFGFVIDFAVKPASSSIRYNDFKFQLVNDQYQVSLNGKQHVFVFFPGDIEYVTISAETKALLEKPVLTVTYDPESDLSDNFGEAQYYFEVQLGGVKTIDRAITREGALPTKTCEGATEFQPVIELRTGSSAGISSEGNCIFVTALDAFDLYQQTERIIYTMLGVMS